MTLRDGLGDPATGDDFLDALDDRFAVIWNGVILHMTDVAGTADDVTATVTPAVGVGGYQNSMAFSIVWAAANTVSNMTLNGLPVVNSDGSALSIGAVEDGLASVLLVVDDEFRIMSGLAAGSSVTRHYHYVITTVGANTFTLPTGLDDDAIIEVELFAGGGGGHSSSGAGGGGGYAKKKFRALELASSTTLTIGAGGAVGAAGGNTTFGTHLTAFGGIAGGLTYGGGGGGSNERGSTFVGGIVGGGYGGLESAGQSATGMWGGGGGGYTDDGGSAVYGGGGGAAGSGTGGTSKFAGAGGESGVAGSAPSGGGGRNAAGARGEARIHIYA